MRTLILSLTLALPSFISASASAGDGAPLPSSRLVKVQAIAPMPAGVTSPLGESQLVMAGPKLSPAEKDLVLVLVFDPLVVKQRWVTQVHSPGLTSSDYACISGEGKAARVNSLPGPTPSCDAGMGAISGANAQ